MKKIAIIGTGIAGMGAAYVLRGKYDITMYEAEHAPGGHTNTVTIDENGTPVHMDSAFMVYNETTYPLLTRLFKELDVITKPTDMSFSFQHRASNLEYCGTGLNGLFAQRQNLLKPWYWRMLLDIQRFSRESAEVLTDKRFEHYSMAQYVKERGYSEHFLQKFLIPMSSAVWSTVGDRTGEFPAKTLIRFFTNHCFLGLKDHLQWRTCEGGSRQYRDKLLAVVNARMLTSRAVTAVRREANSVRVTDVTGEAITYDHIILACHSDTALKLIENSTDLERDILHNFQYQHNRITLHTDESVMPQTKSAWSSWNYRVEPSGDASTIYWMNNLQGVSKNRNYFVSVNDHGVVDPAKILWKTMYSHPIYNVAAQDAQAHLPKLNRNGLIYFAGAYFRYGFHEDGLMAGVDAARALAGENLWA